MSEPEEIVVTRAQLYELVWSKPMRTLAKEFGISDVALGKWCRKMEIPRPGVGHWQKLEAGKKVTRPKLPDPTREDELVFKINPIASEESPPAQPLEAPNYELFEQRPENKIVVPEKTSSSPPTRGAVRARAEKRLDRRSLWLDIRQRSQVSRYASSPRYSRSSPPTHGHNHQSARPPTNPSRNYGRPP